MSAVIETTGLAAARVPGPTELLPGRPDAIVDLQTDEGVALVGGTWHYSDAHVEEIDFVEVGAPEDPLGPGEIPNRTYDVVPHAEGADFDDSGWRTLAPAETMLRLGNGRVSFNWYRLEVTIPEGIGDFDPTGSTVVFEVVVDDYAEVWVDGELPLALGMTGGRVAGGFNVPNRVVLTRDAKPGERFQLAVFGINGPISASPRNYIWMRSATLDFYAPERARTTEPAKLEVESADDRLAGIVPAGVRLDRMARSSGSRAASSSPRDRSGHAPAPCSSARRTRTLSTAGRPRAASTSSGRRAATRASTSAATTSPARTDSPSAPTAC